MGFAYRSDVFDDPDKSLRTPVGRANRAAVDTHPEHFSIGLHIAVLIEETFFAPQIHGSGGHNSLGVFGMDARAELGPLSLFHRQAVDFQEPVVGVQHGAFFIDPEHAHRSGRAERAEHFLALAKPPRAW